MFYVIQEAGLLEQVDYYFFKYILQLKLGTSSGSTDSLGEMWTSSTELST